MKKRKDSRFRRSTVDRTDGSTGSNKAMEDYYRTQSSMDNEELDAMWQSYRRPLPLTFRVSKMSSSCQDLAAALKEDYVKTLPQLSLEGETLTPPKVLAWYPDQLAWQLNVHKKVMRKEAQYKRFQSFLVYETEVGNISRSEAVSMIPPLLLDVQPHHFVLDMCAAPGSKTAQIIEALHQRPGTCPDGLVVANESDYKRSHMLVHQAARLSSPCLMVTNWDGTAFPALNLSSTQTLEFDRVLCDVPCSGDGTLRKNPGIWNSWSVANGNGLHLLQQRIAQRGFQLLKEGGRLVYSTCSMNPVENEAVIAALLNANDDMELIDVSHELPMLKRAPGLSSWRVCTKSGEWLESFDQIKDSDTVKKMAASIWPPDNADTLNLQRCIRIYPHYQDTGGFFIAVLQKSSRKNGTASRIHESRSSEGNAREEIGIKRSSSSASAPVEKRLKVDDDYRYKEDPYAFVDPEHAELARIKEYFHIPAFPGRNIFVRNGQGDMRKLLYLTNDSVRSVMQSNSAVRCRLINAGVKIFAKQDISEKDQCPWRILSDGIDLLFTHVDREQAERDSFYLSGDLSDLKTLIEFQYPKFDDLSKNLAEGLKARPLGCCLVKIHPDQGQGTVALLQASAAAEDVPRLPNHTMILPLWRSKVSCNLTIAKAEKAALSRRVFGVDLIVQSTLSRDDRDDEPELGSDEDGLKPETIGVGVQGETRSDLAEK